MCDDNCRMILNSKKLVAIKENTIIVQYIRNPHDGLWDILVAKSSIIDHNFTTPVHPGVYPSLNLNKNARANVIQRSKPQARNNKIPKCMRGFDNLIESNKLDAILTEHSEQDNLQYTRVNAT